jgi:aminotransferase in exopolysaccharide biosynthesis
MNQSETHRTIHFIREQFKTPESFIPLHVPTFIGNEKKYLSECIDSTFVSSVGKFVDRFEEMMVAITGAKYAIATVNGTAALHIAMHAIGVDETCEVITQPLTFVATCNAISYTNATSIFVDVDKDTMGLSPASLEEFLQENCEIQNNQCINKNTRKIVKACVPMHTFGFPCRIQEIVEICNRWNITVIEDAAESLGSYADEKHTGTFGTLGTFSFNGNKVVTAGGGGCVVTDDEVLAKRLKHLTTTAKEPHSWEYYHKEVGFNYRMPNINAALICAQLECLPQFLKQKRILASSYKEFFESLDLSFQWEQEGTKANFWLNTVILKDTTSRNAFLKETNEKGVMTRPAWQLMSSLPMFKDSPQGDLSNAKWLEERVVNIPSSVTQE